MFIKEFHLFLFFLLSTLFLSACTFKKEIGTQRNPIHFALVPGKDVQVLETNGKKLEAWLNANTPYHFSIFVPHNYVAVIESLGSKKTDIAVLNTFGYILARKRYQVNPLFTLTSEGRDHYKGEIIVHKDGPKTIADLQKKKFAFVDPLSASGYLMALHFLKKNNIEPGETVFAGRHDSVVTMVYQKRVDAGAVFYVPNMEGKPMDARAVTLNTLPDVFEKVKVLDYTESLPNEAMVTRADFPEPIRKLLIEKLLLWSKTPQGKETLKALYATDGLKIAKDSDYDPARELLKYIGKTLE